MEEPKINDLKSCIEQNQESLYRLAYSYTGNREAALDVVQETAARSLEKFDTLRDPDHMKSWLFRVLVRTGLDWCRKNKRTVPLSEVPEPVSPDAADGLAETLDVYRAVQRLKPKLRTVIILRYYEDLKLDDIARITHVPLNTVKSRQRRGLQQIRQYL